MLTITSLNRNDIAEIVAAFRDLGWNKPAEQYERYADEAERGERTIFVARENNAFAGYVTVKWAADYAHFREAEIPEIQDFNVLPAFRRKRIGSRLMDVTEVTIAVRSSIAGLGVAFDPDYGPAQRLYALRGYVPDGRGGVSHGAPVKWGDMVTVDDDLVIYLTKRLQS